MAAWVRESKALGPRRQSVVEPFDVHGLGLIGG